MVLYFSMLMPVNLDARACLKKAFCKMCVTVCGRCCLNEGGVAGYVNRMKVKYAAKWGVQIAGMIFQTRSRACLKKAFRELRVSVCGRFYPNEGGVAGYGNRMRVKYTAKWGLQIAEMIFQTRSSTKLQNLQIIFLLLKAYHCPQDSV